MKSIILTLCLLSSSPAWAESLLKVDPFLAVVGGLKADSIIEGADESRQGRVSAMAISAFGISGTIGERLSFVSELMANGGASLHGASAWEGQAAFQVRRQMVRLRLGDFSLEGGRIIDQATVNFVSGHAQDTLLQDAATREPLLYSGFNMGNGLHAAYQILDGLQLGLTFTAGNPVATTASLEAGGSFPPFDRFYIQPYQAVQQAANSFPDDTFHILLISPSLTYDPPGSIFEARAAYQQFIVDTNTNRRDDQNIRGFNLRGNVRAKLWEERLVPFFNVALEMNDTVQATDSAKLSPDKYQSICTGGGLDFNWSYAAPGRGNGVGIEYEHVQYQVGGSDVTHLHYFNLGGTYWIEEHTALGLRAALWMRATPGTPSEGERSLIATMRVVL